MPEETSAPAAPIKKPPVANRSEIAIRVFRTAHELAVRNPRFSNPAELRLLRRTKEATRS